MASRLRIVVGATLAAGSLMFWLPVASGQVGSPSPPGRATLEISVAVDDGRLPSGVRIHTERVDGEPFRRSLFTPHVYLEGDRDRTVTLGRLEPGLFHFRVSGHGLPASDAIEVELAAGATRNVSVTLRAKAPEVAIQVTDEAARPIPGARVTIGEFDLVWGEGRTGEAGIFRTSAPMDPRTEAHITAPGHAPQLVRDLLRKVEGGETRVILERAVDVEVVVREANGEPAENIWVRVEELGTRWSRATERVHSGLARFRAVAVGRRDFTVVSREHGGQWLGRFSLDLKSETGPVQHQYWLEKPIVVRGTVTRDGSPVTRGRVSIAPWGSFPVQRDGGFAAEVRGAGLYTLVYAPVPGHPGPRQILFVREPTTTVLEFETTPFSLEVVDPAGRPVPRALGEVARHGSYHIRTDAQGRFSMGMAIPGSYEWRFDPPHPGLVGLAAPVEVARGASRARYRFHQGVPLHVEVEGRRSFDVYHVAIDGRRTTLRPVEDRPDHYWWPAGESLGIVEGVFVLPAPFVVDPDRPGPISITLKRGARPTQIVVGPHPDSEVGVPLIVESLGEETLPVQISRRLTNPGTTKLNLPFGSYRVRAVRADGSERSAVFEVGHRSRRFIRLQ